MPKISKAEGPTSVSDPGLPPHFEAEAEPEDRAEPAEDSNVPSTAPPFTVAIDEQAESRIAEEGEQAEQTEQVDTEEAAEPASTVSTEYTRPTRRRR